MSHAWASKVALQTNRIASSMANITCTASPCTCSVKPMTPIPTQRCSPAMHLLTSDKQGARYHISRFSHIGDKAAPTHAQKGTQRNTVIAPQLAQLRHVQNTLVQAAIVSQAPISKSSSPSHRIVCFGQSRNQCPNFQCNHGSLLRGSMCGWPCTNPPDGPASAPAARRSASAHHADRW